MDEEKAKIDEKTSLLEKFSLENIMLFIFYDLEYYEYDEIQAIVYQLGLFCAHIVDWRRLREIIVIATINNIAVCEKDRIVLERRKEKAARDKEKWNTLNKK